MEKYSRNYGIDLLRIISMYMVVILHVLGHGGMLGSLNVLTVNSQILYVLEIFSYGAVNIFAIISGFVGINAEHKYKNIIKLWLQVFFYSILGIVIEVLLHFFIDDYAISIKDMVKRIFPVIFNGYWYFTAYFCLFFFMPALNMLINNMQKKYLITLFIFIVIFFTVFDSINPIISFGIKGGYSFLWLAILYCIGAYLKKYNSFSKIKISHCLLIFLASNLSVVIIRIILMYSTNYIFGEPHLYSKILDYNNIFVLTSSIFIVVAFSKVTFKDRVNNIILSIAPMSFGVYIIHLTPVVWKCLNNLFIVYLNYNAAIQILLVLSTALGIFVVASIVDAIRIQLFKLCKVDVVANKIEKTIRDIYNKVLLRFKLAKEENVDTDENI